jgi:hypothetical protein
MKRRTRHTLILIGLPLLLMLALGGWIVDAAVAARNESKRAMRVKRWSACGVTAEPRVRDQAPAAQPR